MITTDSSPIPATDEHELHLRLTRFNALRLNPALPSAGGLEALENELAERSAEWRFLESERARIIERAAPVPRQPAEMVAWFDELEHTGPGQFDPLFDYLAEEATLEEMCWFLTQEIAGEAGFDDLVALTQIKMPTLAKLEFARNYWDEMGRGQAKGMHGALLEGVARELKLVARPEATVWESLALANLLTGLACSRRYAYHSVGALGVIELTAPSRVSLVNKGLKRLGVSGQSRQYFALHATLDVKHSDDWNREILLTLVAERPELATPIAEGALMRLEAGARCYERYRRELGL